MFIERGCMFPFMRGSMCSVTGSTVMLCQFCDVFFKEGMCGMCFVTHTFSQNT